MCLIRLEMTRRNSNKGGVWSLSWMIRARMMTSQAQGYDTACRQEWNTANGKCITCWCDGKLPKCREYHSKNMCFTVREAHLKYSSSRFGLDGEPMKGASTAALFSGRLFGGWDSRSKKQGKIPVHA